MIGFYGFLLKSQSEDRST